MNKPEKTINQHSISENSWQSEVMIWGITILLAAILGIVLDGQSQLIEYLTLPAFLVLKILVALAIPMFFLVIIYNLITIKIPGKTWRNLLFPLFSNTTLAILIGFVVAHLFHPGSWGNLITLNIVKPVQPTLDPSNIENFWDAILGIIQNLVPTSLVEPLVNNNVIQIIVVAFSLGIVLRAIKSEQIIQKKTDYQPLENVIEVLLEAVKVILRWVIKLLPLAVFGILLKNIVTQGFAPLLSLVMFVLTILVALFIQACYYLFIIKLGSSVKPVEFLRQGSEVFREAFISASSSSTLPMAHKVFRDKIPLTPEASGLGVFVGAKLNKDGTIILMVTSVLYISQMLGQNLSLGQLFFLILASIFASIGSAGIPNAGLVTLTLVFTAVNLPIDYIAVILSVEWFIDKFYTLINVMGYMTVSVLLHGKKPLS
ncbi:dicarboxylate/amino acid:cation symporter [Plectonema cf. radiosum LEGE 06105]|uniref:Dicarboxylate/amino acid:cation symporter n=1 Tax=Plectonema cf. radiosum LEGE 06105 TaxID=945769 RepID=A0A8J7K3R3_9CYAN|nr:dicarboxylate/amino acid:cation symporter [Plectonema radiosum]MBE9216001.1 dicarboxylate/amino acid:cation symporter [Plectonema cf. radiosum LEGE 06105]